MGTLPATRIWDKTGKDLKHLSQGKPNSELGTWGEEGARNWKEIYQNITTHYLWVGKREGFSFCLNIFLSFSIITYLT